MFYLLQNYPVLPLLATFGYAISFLGVALIGANLYKGLPFEGETLGDVSKDPITREERRQIKSIGLWGLFLILIGFVLVSTSWWLQWAFQY